MNATLQQFYDNEGQREAVKVFMVETLKEMTVELAFEGKSVVGIPETSKLIDRTFDRLEELYGKIEKPIINNPR